MENSNGKRRCGDSVMTQHVCGTAAASGISSIVPGSPPATDRCEPLLHHRYEPPCYRPSPDTRTRGRKRIQLPLPVVLDGNAVQPASEKSIAALWGKTLGISGKNTDRIGRLRMICGIAHLFIYLILATNQGRHPKGICG